jgi:hypothetical protein
MNSVTVFRSAFFAVMIGSLIGNWSALAQEHTSRAECPFNEALDFQVVQALKANGVTDEQFEALADAGEIGRTMSGVCIAELNYAATNPETICQQTNGMVLLRLLSYKACSLSFCLNWRRADISSQPSCNLSNLPKLYTAPVLVSICEDAN